MWRQSEGMRCGNQTLNTDPAKRFKHRFKRVVAGASIVLARTWQKPDKRPDLSHSPCSLFYAGTLGKTGIRLTLFPVL